MKKLSKILIVFIALLLFAVPGWTASSMYQKLDCKGNACILRLSWTTHTDGSFTGVPTMEVNGWIDAIETDPGGTAAPTDNYDISIKNQVVSSVNEAGTFTNRVTNRTICGDTGSWSTNEITTSQDGVLANRDTANTEMTRLLDNGNYGGVMNHGPLVVDVSNAGNSKKGMINIYFFKMK